MFTVDYKGRTYNAADFAATRLAFVADHTYRGTLDDYLAAHLTPVAHVMYHRAAMGQVLDRAAHLKFLADNPDPIVYQLQRNARLAAEAHTDEPVYLNGTPVLAPVREFSQGDDRAYRGIIVGRGARDDGQPWYSVRDRSGVVRVELASAIVPEVAAR